MRFFTNGSRDIVKQIGPDVQRRQPGSQLANHIEE
jgi:hypothetical protein